MVYYLPKSSRKEVEARRGRLGKYGTHHPKKGGGVGCLLCFPGMRQLGEYLRSLRKRRVVPGSEKEELKFFACITRQVGGWWVWRS